MPGRPSTSVDVPPGLGDVSDNVSDWFNIGRRSVRCRHEERSAQWCTPLCVPLSAAHGGRVAPSSAFGDGDCLSDLGQSLRARNTRRRDRAGWDGRWVGVASPLLELPLWVAPGVRGAGRTSYDSPLPVREREGRVRPRDCRGRKRESEGRTARRGVVAGGQIANRPASAFCTFSAWLIRGSKGMSPTDRVTATIRDVASSRPPLATATASCTRTRHIADTR